jgi:hypothetical protein
MTIPQNIKKIKEAFSIEQVNTHLWTGAANDTADSNRRAANERARGL